MNAFTILINGRNNAGAAFDSVEGEMTRLNRTASRFRGAFMTGAFIAVFWKLAKAIASCTTYGDEFAEKAAKVKSAWRDVGAVIADGFKPVADMFYDLSEKAGKGLKSVIDGTRQNTAAIAARIAGYSKEEAEAAAWDAVNTDNTARDKRRYDGDASKKDLDKKLAEWKEKNSTATERLAAATAKLAEEEQKLAGMGQYDLARVPVLNSILELQGKITSAMKDQAAESAKIRADEIAIEQERVADAARDVKLNQAAFQVERVQVGKSYGQRLDERRQQRALDREKAAAANREEVALKQAERDPSIRYRRQLGQQMARAGMGIGAAGALLNQGEDANVPRSGARGISDRYARLLGAKNAVADSEKNLAAVEAGAAKRMGEINAATPEMVPLDAIKAATEKMAKTLGDALKPA